MAWSLDARIPLTLVADAAALAAALAAGPKSAVLAEPRPAGRGHGSGNLRRRQAACRRLHLLRRSPAAATALDRLFQARLRGRCGWFTRVVALAGSEAARAQIAAALAGDAVTAARFRPA